MFCQTRCCTFTVLVYQSSVCLEFSEYKTKYKSALFDVVCGGVDNPAFNFFISLVSFCIYKEWIHYYKNTKDWKNNDIVIFVKRNVTLYLDNYKHCKNCQQ